MKRCQTDTSLRCLQKLKANHPSLNLKKESKTMDFTKIILTPGNLDGITLTG